MPDQLVLPAFAKLNLDLRVLSVRPDGYHDLRTVFQTLALHDTLTFTPSRGRLEIESNDPGVPTDGRNLVAKAASLVGERLQGQTRTALAGLRIRIEKRVPSEAGLGGASADAAATLLALSQLWNLSLDIATLSRLGARLGADVPFFFAGGTALGLGRGDDIYPLVDLPRTFVVIVQPPFGVLTADAYGWFDRDPRPARSRRSPRVPAGWPLWARDLRNDLEPVVAARHPLILRTKRGLLRAGAAVAAMSGSGSAVFGLFEQRASAVQAARRLVRPGWRVLTTRTLSRGEHTRAVRRALAGNLHARVS